MNQPGQELKTPAAGKGLLLGWVAFTSALVALALASFAFWPTSTWKPPRRPRLSAPIVFDELIAPGSPQSASSGSAESAPR